MAKITFKRQSEYFLKLKQLETHFVKNEVLERAVHKGAAIVADEIRKNLESLPEEQFRHLDTYLGDYFREVPTGQKIDIAEGFGLTPIERDSRGFVHTKAGFEGYGSYPTNAYPQGVPNALIARAIESGSSVRNKTPFVRTAVNASRKEAVKAMEKSIDDDTKKIFEGG